MSAVCQLLRRVLSGGEGTWFSTQGEFAVFTVTRRDYQQFSIQLDYGCQVSCIDFELKDWFGWKNVGRYEVVPVLGRDTKNPSVHSVHHKNIPRQPQLLLPGLLNKKQRRERTWDPTLPNPAQSTPWEGCQYLQWAARFGRRRQWHPTPVLLPGKSHGWRSQVGCSPWGRQESDTTERLLSLFTFMHWKRKWQPTPAFLPGESQGRWSLVGCCLWGRTELDTTEAT